MKTIVISHANDVDGVGCAALLKMQYGTRDSDIFLIDYSSDALKAVERAIRKARPKSASLFITDLSANDEKVGLFLSIIGTIRKGGGKVFWFDHHPWTKNAAKKISKKCDRIICGERDECASEITVRELKLKGRFVDAFKRICHYSDFNLKPRDRRTASLIKTYALGIASYNIMPKAAAQRRLKELAGTLSGGKLTNSDLVKEARKFELISRKRIRTMTKELSLIGGKIAVGFAKSLQSTNACYWIIRESGRDIGIFINLDAKKGNIRSVVSDISPLAAALGGGGHPHASGFSFDPKRYDVKTWRGRMLIMDRIEREAAKLGL